MKGSSHRSRRLCLQRPRARARGIAARVPSGRRTASALASWAALAVLAAAVAQAQPGTAPEELVRGALVYNFAKFITWPEERERPDAAFRICIDGDDAFAELLTRKVEGRDIRGRPIEVGTPETAPDRRACQVAFLAPRTPERLTEILEELRHAPVLTIGSQPDFLDAGGMINLVLRDQKLGFAVNLPASRRAGLDLNARLLRAAVHVEQDE